MASTSPQPIRDYKDLHVWQKGMELAKQVYLLASRLPSDRKFGLVSQMRRAAVSIPSNIAEGQARSTTGEFVQFLSHAEGSAAELDTQLRLSIELGYFVVADLSEVFRLSVGRSEDVETSPTFAYYDSMSKALRPDCQSVNQPTHEPRITNPEPRCLTIFVTPSVFC
jgi:four helix bundle protein